MVPPLPGRGADGNSALTVQRGTIGAARLAGGSRGHLQGMDQLRRTLLALAAGSALAVAPVACGDDDDANDARDKVEDAAGQVKSEAEDLQDSVDSEGEREKRLDKLEKKLDELRDDGSARADDVKREIERLREQLDR